MAGVTFIVKGNTLVTVRYDEPHAFAMFANRAAKPGGCGPTAEAVLAGLIETVIDRSAEVLQQAAERIDGISRRVFEARDSVERRSAEYQETLRSLGRFGDLISKARESLVSIERVLLFLSASYRTARVPRRAARAGPHHPARPAVPGRARHLPVARRFSSCSTPRSVSSTSSRTTSSSCSRSWPWSSCRRRSSRRSTA